MLYDSFCGLLCIAYWIGNRTCKKWPNLVRVPRLCPVTISKGQFWGFSLFLLILLILTIYFAAMWKNFTKYYKFWCNWWDKCDLRGHLGVKWDLTWYWGIIRCWQWKYGKNAGWHPHVRPWLPIWIYSETMSCDISLYSLQLLLSENTIKSESKSFSKMSYGALCPAKDP